MVSSQVALCSLQALRPLSMLIIGLPDCFSFLSSLSFICIRELIYFHSLLMSRALVKALGTSGAGRGPRRNSGVPSTVLGCRETCWLGWLYPNIHPVW